ncbi:MAG: endonuclease domain-containing protein [Planctomycetota bacterium]|nr:endonuclease domain-containing protein [Planctomycetota bacterium]MDA1211860.1 endonuclease domain-containing protein [Planctomycetota bacterium]
MSHDPLGSRAYVELIEFVRTLRQQQTDAEQLMWMLLRNRRFLGLKFRRQHPFTPYVLDFYCESLKLGIELDGGQHNTPEARQYDLDRSRYLADRGVKLVRFWNHEVLTDFETVVEAIALHADKIMKGRISKE